jgi:hypothetical protein
MTLMSPDGHPVAIMTALDEITAPTEGISDLG